MATGTHTEIEAVAEIIRTVWASEDNAHAITLYRNRHETHEISYNSFEKRWELSQNNIGEVIFSHQSLAVVATQAVEEELWIGA